MRTKYFLRIYHGKQITERELVPGTPCSAGGTAQDALFLEGLPAGALTARLDGSDWTLESRLPGKEPVTNSSALGRMLLVDRAARIAATVYSRTIDGQYKLDLSGVEQLTLGRGDDCSIVLTSSQISETHLELRRTSDGWHMEDQKSTNGTYLNGVLTRSADLQPNDILDIGLCRFRIQDNTLHLLFDGSVTSHLTGSSSVRSAASPTDPYPFEFFLSPRLRDRLPSGEVELQSPPAIGGKPEISWLNVLLTPLLTVGVMLVICLAIGGPLTMLYFSAPMTILGAVMTIVRLKGEKKKFAAKQQLRLQKYEDYLGQQIADVEQQQNEQRRILLAAHPSAAQCVEMVNCVSRQLWERRPSDDDFMSLRLGIGPAPSLVALKTPRQALSLEEDKLADRPTQLAAEHRFVADCPITIDLQRFPTAGIIGPRKDCAAAAKNLIVQAATHHSYEDLRIVILCDNLKEWDAFRWLPHVFDDTRSSRLIASHPSEAAKMLNYIHEILVQRHTELMQSEQAGIRPPSPYYLLVCADSSLLHRHAIQDYIHAGDPRLGVGALFLYDRLEYLPKECQTIVELGSENSVYPRINLSERRQFQPDVLPNSQYETFARAMAPLRMEPSGGRKELPTNLSFLQGYGVKEPKNLPILKNWEDARPEAGMAVPIGMADNGGHFLFDIHEKRHGPHGLVAGMTGSGKSEMVQSWILSMAVRFPPSAVSFVLIDFKGTGLLLPFRNLPHLAGSISDLDTSIGRNLLALENELTRRKALLDRSGVSNISGYLKLLRQGRASEPLPYLFIVIDEFAEFKARFPDFMQVVNRVFAIGRTLGVHILLLTQKPGSVVDDKMNANTRFRWCLKVANSADSKDMLKHPDAARITNPGRAYVQVGEDEVYTQIQSFWSGAPYNPLRDPAISRARKISVVDITGQRISYEPEKTTGFRSEKNEIDAIVEHLDALTRRHNIPRADAIWTAKLPDHIELRSVLQIAFDGEHWNQEADALRPAIGMVDDPRSQSQYPLKLDLSEEGSLAVYGAPGTGKTTLLHSLIMSLALSYSPDAVSMYLMDFGGGSLNLFRNLPHVGGVAIDGDDERISKLSVLISHEVARRKKLLAEQGLVNIASYREATGEQLPYIVLILDNFAPVLNLYPDLDQFFQSLVRDGGACGIYLATTATAQNSISYRISQNIKNTIALRLQDKSDYASIVGRTDGMEPENHPGRGLIKGKPPLEFQTALPADGATESQRVKNLRELIRLMDEKWTGCRPAPIPVMPDVVRSADFPCEGLLAGLSRETVEPRTIDLEARQFLMISCHTSGNAAFRALLKQAVQRLPGVRTLVYGKDAELGDSAECISSPEQFDQAVAQLMPVLQARKERVAAGGSLPAEEFPWLLLAIPDLGSCFEAVSNDTMRRLSNVVVLGAGLRVCLIACGSAKDIAKLYHSGDAFTMAMVRQADALLLGGNMQNHNVFQTDLSYTEAAVTLGSDEGYLLQNGAAEKLRVVTE